MKLENHVVSLELAKQLKEAGYPQGSYFEWVITRGDFTKLIRTHSEDEQRTQVVFGKIIDRYAAPLASDLGEQLPFTLWSEKYKTQFWLSLSKEIDNQWFVDYRTGNDGQLKAFIDKSEADARAKMWLYLKREGLLEASSTNLTKTNK